MNNLSSEEDDDYTKLQRIEDTSNVQLTTIYVITVNEKNYLLTIKSNYTADQQKRKKQRIL
jgi:hypothetical protein